MDSKILNYGSLITISTKEGFYLSSEGFINSQPILREAEALDYSSSVFRVIPKCMYSIQTSIINYMQELRDIDPGEKLAQLLKLEENLEGEIRTNINSFNLFNNQEVCYDSLIQLVHLKSHKFLTLKGVSSALSEKDNFRLTFEDFPSEHSHFRIVPSFKYQELGSGRVRFSDKVYFQILVPELRKLAWMHGSRGTLNEDPEEIEDSCFGSQARNLEVNMSLDLKTRWLIGFYGDVENDEKLLACGDYVRLNLPEFNIILTAQNDEGAKVFFSKELKDSNGIWMIENENPLTGGLVNENDLYHLKHITSGKFLGVSSHPKLFSKPSSRTLWRFVFFRSKKSLKSEEICYLINNQSNVCLTCNEEGEVELSKEPDEKSIYQPCKVDSEFIWELLFMLHCNPILHDFPERTKNLFKEEGNHKKMLRILEYCKSVTQCLTELKLFVQNQLKTMIGLDNHYGEVQYQRQMMLYEQKFFLSLVNMLQSSVFEDNYQLIKRKCLKDQRFNIKKPKKNKEIQKVSVLIEILSEIYKLLICTCNKNTNNQKELFKYRGIFVKHVGLRLGATKLLLEIFRNNEELVLQVGNDKEVDLISIYIQKFQSFEQVDWPELMKFLKGTCIFKGEPISVNQDLVFTKIFKEKEIARRVSVKTEVQNGNMTVFNNNLTFILNSCFDDGRVIGLKRNIKYIGYYLKLCASLVKGRNFETSELMIKTHSFKNLEETIWNKSLTVKIRACHCKFLLDLYIDCYLRELSIKPNFIKLIRHHPQLNLIPPPPSSTESYAEAFNQSQECMPQLVEKLFEFFKKKNRLPKFDNVLTYNLVKIVEKMIHFEILSPDQDLKNSQKFQLTKMIKKMADLIDLDDRFGYPGDFQIYRKMTRIIPKVSSEFRTSYLKYLSAISKDLRNFSNPIVRSSQNLKKFLNFYKQNPLNGLVRKMTSHKIKLKICEILNYYLMIRQDYLLENMMIWFKSNYLNHEIDLENKDHKDNVKKLENLLPQIQIPAKPEEIKEKVKNNSFLQLKIPEIPDLESLCPGIILTLIKKFLMSNNYQLQTAFLELIFRNYRQRTEYLKNISKLHVLSRYDDISLYIWLKNTLLALKQDCEKSEIWMKYWEYKKSDCLKHKEVFKEVIEKLKNIQYFFHEDVYMDDNGPTEPKSKTISKSRQEILYFLNVHTIIINLIKDGLHKLASIDHQKKELKDAVKLLNDLFVSCFKVLKRFVYTNKRNQKKMFKFMPVITQFLYLDLGQIPLICEIFRDNLVLINKIDLPFLQIFENLIKNYGRQAEFLKIFEVITVFGNKPVLSMQRMVLSMFIKEEINTYMLYMTNDKHPVFMFEKEHPKNNYFKDEPIKYHSTLILVLSKCGFGSSGKHLNEARCQNLINLENLFFILSKCNDPSGTFASLKIPLLVFFYNIYLDCEVINFELKLNPLFLKFLADAIQELEEIYELDEKFLEFFPLLVKIIFKYKKIFIKKIPKKDSEQDDIKTIEKFSVIVKEKQDLLSEKFNFEITDMLREICSTFDIFIYINNQICNEDCDVISPFSLQRSGSVLDNQIVDVPDIQKWIKIREFFIFSKRFKKMIEKEDLALNLVFLNYPKCNNDLNYYIDFSTILKSLITFIRHSLSQKCPRKILISVINLIGSFIDNPLGKRKIKEKDKKIIEKQRNILQIKLSYYGLTHVILTMLMDQQLETPVFKALINLSTKLLEGGNYQIQQEFYQFFLTYPSSDHFFSKINSIFDKKIDQVSKMIPRKFERRKVFNERKQFIKVLLRFLQLLCENHNRFLQNYIRYQEKSNTNFNLITKIVSLLDILMKKKIYIHFPIISQCFETLTELIQGPCFENQEEILNTNFIEITEQLLSINEYEKKIRKFKGIQLTSTHTFEIFNDEEELVSKNNYNITGWMVAHLKLKCMITVISLFEGRKDNLVSTKIIRGMNLEIFQENIKAIYINYINISDFSYNYDIFNRFHYNDGFDIDFPEKKQDEDSDNHCSIIENGFLLYHIIKTLQDSKDPEHIEALTHELSLLFEKNDSINEDSLKKAKTRSLKNNEISNFVVYRYNYCGLPQNAFELKNLIKDAYGFFEKHTGNIEVVFNGQIFRIYFYLPPAYKGFTKEIKEDFHRKANRDSEQAKLKYMIDSIPDIIRKIEHEFLLLKLIKKSTIAHFIATYVERFRQAAFVLTILLNLTIMTSYKHEREELSAYTLTPDDEGLGVHKTKIWLNVLGISQLVFCLFIVIFFLAKAGPNLAKKGWKIKRKSMILLKSSKHTAAHILLKTIQVIRTIFFVLSDIDVLYYVCYLVFSVLGTVLHPFYFSLLLLDVVYRNPSLQNVVNSIYLPRQALVLTFLLMIVLVYIFSIFGYWMFEDYFNPNCKSLAQCFYIVWDLSFKYDGGIGGALGTPSSPSYDPMRFFYDNIYNILVMIVLMGVVQGIIIDTFARLREEQEYCKKDMKNKCFICGHERDFIEKNTVKGFIHHIENDHNIWNYILFICYLLSKESTEYSGIESYVREQYDKDDLAWIPNKVALSVRDQKTGTQQENLKRHEVKLSELENKIKELE